MASKWLLTLSPECDRERLARALARLGVAWDPRARTLPLDGGEVAITVTASGDELPAGVSKLAGVLRAHPSSQMKLARKG